MPFCLPVNLSNLQLKAMEKKYGVKIAEADEVQRIFSSVDTIAGHILSQRPHPAGA